MKLFGIVVKHTHLLSIPPAKGEKILLLNSEHVGFNEFHDRRKVSCVNNRMDVKMQEYF